MPLLRRSGTKSTMRAVALTFTPSPLFSMITSRRSLPGHLMRSRSAPCTEPPGPSANWPNTDRLPREILTSCRRLTRPLRSRKVRRAWPFSDGNFAHDISGTLTEALRICAARSTLTSVNAMSPLIVKLPPTCPPTSKPVISASISAIVADGAALPMKLTLSVSESERKLKSPEIPAIAALPEISITPLAKFATRLASSIVVP